MVRVLILKRLSLVFAHDVPSKTDGKHPCQMHPAQLAASCTAPLDRPLPLVRVPRARFLTPALSITPLCSATKSILSRRERDVKFPRFSSSDLLATGNLRSRIAVPDLRGCSPAKGGCSQLIEHAWLRAGSLLQPELVPRRSELAPLTGRTGARVWNLGHKSFRQCNFLALPPSGLDEDDSATRPESRAETSFFGLNHDGGRLKPHKSGLTCRQRAALGQAVAGV